jgi:hypothetical protein
LSRKRGQVWTAALPGEGSREGAAHSEKGNGYVHFLLLVQEKVDRKRRTPERGMFRFIPLSGLSPFSDQREGCGPLFGNTPGDALLGGEIKEGNRARFPSLSLQGWGSRGKGKRNPFPRACFLFFPLSLCTSKEKMESALSFFANSQ